MRESDLRSKCRVNSNYEMDTFVGLRCRDGDISINFPMGYHISEDSEGLRGIFCCCLQFSLQIRIRRSQTCPDRGSALMKWNFRCSPIFI